MTLGGVATLHIPVVLAHFGHWYVQLLFVAPVAFLVAVLSYQGWRDKRSGKVHDDENE